MSLTGAIQIGRSALTASQIGIQVASNNMANAATPGYSRQALSLDPIRGVRQSLSAFVGRGVSVGAIQRQVSEGLRTRLEGAISEQAAARTSLDLFSAIEAALGELGDADLSSELNEFFGAWSERANLTESSAVVVQRGQQLAGFLNRVSADLRATRGGIDADLDIAITESNRLVNEIADLNNKIVAAEVGAAIANDLRDKRDKAIAELSQMMDVNSVEQASGAKDILLGSTPIVLGDTARPLAVQRVSSDAGVNVAIVAGDNQREVRVASGRIGALLESRDSSVGSTLDDLDRLAAQLTFQINRLHATGANTEGLTTARSTLAFDSEQLALALNDPDNTVIADLPFSAKNGGLFVRVRHEATGQQTVRRIDIDLDGIADDLTRGTQDDTSVQDIINQLDTVPGLNARADAQGRLEITSDNGYTFEFADDSSDTLATLGVNAFFTGTNARDIAVRTDLADQPSRLRVGKIVDGELIENATALAIAQLQDEPLTTLDGESFRGFWQTSVQRVAGNTGTAIAREGAATIVRESLEAQNAGISGVSIDEESIDLLNFQRQYQGAARVISIADQLLQTLMAIV